MLPDRLMILAVGTSPAWQRTLILRDLRAGDVNRALSVHECAAGKPVNVAVAARALGEPSLALIPIGGPTGARLAADAEALGVKVCAVSVGAPTRVCTTLVTESEATEIVEPAGAMTAEEYAKIEQAFHQLPRPDLVVLSGSLAQGVPPTAYRDLLERAACPAIVDARGAELWEALMARPLIVKPTRSELETTFGHRFDSEAELHDAMRDVAGRGAQWVVVSQGGGTLWAFGDGRLYSAEPARVDVKNPIGSGDCLAAGMAVGLCRGCTVPEAIRWGMAAATANTRTLLPARRELRTGLASVDLSEAPRLQRIR